ncbi:MAG: sigma-70 family RNA polymerase sigma factor [Candidatus Poribacteria bacterium]|nr:sigma-70 family RNA polymerase sigma factor [Candidatus Poribacteria bacterium]
MKNEDVELIQRVLAGDDNAFSALVRKYQKPVHALVWRKVGDFHIAEEITQDAFLKAYKELATLKKPHRFARWLSVIATRGCIAWLRKKRLTTQSLEDTSHAQLEKATYSGYVIQENEQMTAEAQREVVQKLLAKLRENERTVITLHYFGEMTHEEISEFLGTSVGTIKSRLRRAQQRLKREEPMVREALSGFQIAPNFTENVMREVSRITPTPSISGSQRFVPWAIAASILAVALLVLGIGYHYFNRFGLSSHSEDSPAATAPKAGKVAFASNRSGSWDIWTMNPDGSDPVNLTRDAAIDLHAAWSPSGKQILFVSFREEGKESSLYLMDADGNHIRKVLDNWYSRSPATWSPDGKQIAAVRDGMLYIITLDDKSVVPVAETGLRSVGDPAWSPDGKEIAFIYLWRKQGYELRLLDVQTLKQKVILAQLERYPYKSYPTWSPDGEQIAFVLHKFRTILNFVDAANWQDEETIYVINRDGSNLRQLVSEKGPDALHPTWSPDGDEIIYHQGIHLPEIGDISQLFKINVNTGTKTQLTNVGSNSGADWFAPPALPVQSKEQ